MTKEDDVSRVETLLKTEEKTILYAVAHLKEGELMTAKSILDQSLRKLEGLKLL